MSKLKLDLGELQVESFEPSSGAGSARGTVGGAMILYQDTGDTGGGGGSGDIFCISNVPCVPTDYVSCIGTCPATCGDGFTCALPCRSA